MRDSFIDVSEMPDSDKPRYTKKDLWRVLEEKNELKLKVYELEEELEQLKRWGLKCVFVWQWPKRELKVTVAGYQTQGHRLVF